MLASSMQWRVGWVIVFLTMAAVLILSMMY